MVFNWNYRALGWFSLPSIWFFQIILVAVVRRLERRVAIHYHFPGDGRDSRHARLLARAGADRARLAHLADAPDLPSHAELLYLESDPARDQRRMGELG